MAVVPSSQPDPNGEVRGHGRTVGLYLHIPFCDQRCHYCDFVTYADKADQIEPYLAALAFEMSLYRGAVAETLFIGGGTPTVLSPDQIERMMGEVRDNFDLSRLTEATVEANPESATPERLAAYRKAGLNRISFGLQATQNRLLERLGRLHDWEGFVTAFNAAREAGFNNRNFDLMFGLPGQTMTDWEEALRIAVSLKPEHISAYALKVEPGTKFDRDGVMADDDLQSDMYLFASKYLGDAGYGHYEISNFALPGFESAHNRRYWLNQETLGLGVGAASYEVGGRRKNVSRLRPYMDACLSGQRPECEEAGLDDREREREDVMLALRLREGVETRRLDALSIPSAALFLNQGLAQIQGGRYALNPRGWLLSNRLFQEFVGTPQN